MNNSLDDFFSQYNVLSYDKDQIIIHADDIPTGVFYLKSGFVKMSSILENGREITLNIFKPGSYFPMIWAITDIPDTYFYKTIAPTELQRAPRDLLIEFVKKNPEALYSLTKRILIGVKGLLLNIEYQLSGDSYHRVIAALVLSTKRFGVKGKSDKHIINIPLTHQEIADLAGLTRETVSLAIEKLVKKKIILYQGKKLVINDFLKLEEESTIDEMEALKPETL